MKFRELFNFNYAWNMNTNITLYFKDGNAAYGKAGDLLDEYGDLEVVKFHPLSVLLDGILEE